MDAQSGILALTQFAFGGVVVALAVTLWLWRKDKLRDRQLAKVDQIRFAPLVWPAITSEGMWKETLTYLREFEKHTDELDKGVDYYLGHVEKLCGINPAWVPSRVRRVLAGVAWTVTAASASDKLGEEQKLMAIWQGILVMQVAAVVLASAANIYEEERVP